MPGLLTPHTGIVKPFLWPVDPLATEVPWAWRRINQLVPYWEGDGEPYKYGPGGWQIMEEANTPGWVPSSEGILRDLTTTGFARDKMGGTGPDTNQSTWMCRFRVASAGNNDNLLTHDTGVNPYFFVKLSGTSFPQSVIARVFDGSVLIDLDGGVVNQDELTTIVVVLDGTAFTMYQDGVQVDTGSNASLAWSDPASNLVIGGAPDGSASMDGAVSTVMTWDQVLNPQEVAMISADPFGVFRPSERRVIVAAEPAATSWVRVNKTSDIAE